MNILSERFDMKTKRIMLNFWHWDEIMSENFSDPGASSWRDGNYCCSFEVLPEIARVVCEK